MQENEIADATTDQSDTSTEQQPEEATEKPKRKRRQRTPKEAQGKSGRKPGFKDWVRVIRSTGNSNENKKIELVINPVTGIAGIITAAPVKEGSDELENDRVQIMRITGYRVDETFNPAPTEAAADGGDAPADAKG